MARRVSRKIGDLLKPFLIQEGIRCSKYPTIKIIRSSPPGRAELVWTFNQLADCYDLTVALLLEMENVQIQDALGPYEVDYLAIVTLRENGGWGEPHIVSGLEDIDPGIDLQKIMERAERFAKKAALAVRFLATITETIRERGT